jgi:cytidine deaminase
MERSVDDLLAAALEAKSNAYAPYSGLKLGAAIRTADDRIFSGANVENAAYPLGQCAEATAIGAMVAAGGGKIREILIASDSAQPVPPCGGCRQRIYEFGGPDTVVHIAGPEGVQATLSLGELLPFVFGAHNLPARR